MQTPKFLLIQNNHLCGPGLVKEFFESTKNVEYELVLSSNKNAFSSIDCKMFGGVIIFGGPMNAWDNDKYPMIVGIKHFIKQSLNNNVPILGLCLGAQLLANVIGSRNFIGNNGPQYGFCKTNWTEHGSNDEFSYFINKNDLDETGIYFHSDTFDLSSNKYYLSESNHKMDINVLGKTNKYISMFKVGHMNYGIQYHIECTFDQCFEWMDIAKNNMIDNGVNPNELKSLANQKQELFHNNGMVMLSKWCQMCLDFKNTKRSHSKL